MKPKTRSERSTTSNFVRALGLAFVTMVALGAFAASAAVAGDAPQVRIEGNFLGVGEQEGIVAVSTTPARLAVPGLGPNVKLTNNAGECTSTGTLIGSAPESPTTGEEIVLSCTGVTVENAPNCSVRSPLQERGTIVTEPLDGTAVWLNEVGGQAGILFTPSEANFVRVIFESQGGFCALEGVPTFVDDEVIGAVAPVEEEVLAGELDLPGAPILNWWNNAEPRVEQEIEQLSIGNQPTTFDATFELFLASGEKVGVFPN